MYADAFSRLHPITFFGYFIMLLAAGAFTMHPVIIALSLLGAVCFALKLFGAAILRKSVFLLIPAFVAAAFNVLFNHRGVTQLAVLPSGNALTLESLLYGCASAAMICSLMIWLYCFGRLYSSDKLLDLTGRLLPSLTIVISMTIRFIPLFARRFSEIKDAQAQLGHSISKGSAKQRFASLARIFSILISRSLETSVAAADSMKSRGYGLPGRSSAKMFRFGVKDIICCVLFLIFGITAVIGEIFAFSDYRYYPAFYLSKPDLSSLVMYISFAVLCLLPTIYDISEDNKWRS